MKQIYANNQTLLQLGRQGENLARKVVFDLSAWEAEYGHGVAELIHQRPGDAAPYPVAAVREGNTLVWTLTATDTAVASSYGSNGHCELRYYVGDVLAKSATWPTKVIPAMDTPSETAPPEPEQGWVDQIIAVGAAAKASADAARADADRAAELAAQAAKKAAQTAQNAEAAAKAKEAAETAKRLAEDAQRAAETAQKAAEEAKAAATQSATDAEAAKQGAEAALKAAQDAAAAADQALADLQALYQEMQTWAQEAIQAINEAGSAAVQSVQDAGDAQVQRVTAEGTRQTSNAKAQADAAAQSASGAAQSAQEAAESAAVYDTVVADVTQLKHDLVDFKDGYGNTNLWNEVELYKENYYVNISDGHLWYSTANDFNIWILPVDGVSKYTFGSDVKGFSVRFMLPLSNDKYTATSSSLLANLTTFDCSQYPNTAYIAFSFSKSTYGSSCIISKGDTAKEELLLPKWAVDNFAKLKTDNISNGIVSKTETFSASGDNILLSNARSNLRKGIRLVFEATVTSGTDFEIGFSVSESSANTYPHNIISVTSDNISYNNVNYPHGLSITGRLQMLFEYLSNGSVDITLISNGNMFKQNVSFTMSNPAVPYVKSNGLIATECKLSFICTDIRKKIWMFGDSYFAYSNARWTYYLKEYGYDNNVLLDGFPGMGSVNARVSFTKLLTLGKPSYAVWFMGMNDGTDTDDITPNTHWATDRDNFIALCEANNVEPIFATIPNVPSINHNGKNAWIKSSGYRYIDMCHAVGADVDVNWYGDMLSPDKIHPSESGAKALFAQVLLDLPEVMLDNL